MVITMSLWWVKINSFMRHCCQGDHLIASLQTILLLIAIFFFQGGYSTLGEGKSPDVHNTPHPHITCHILTYTPLIMQTQEIGLKTKAQNMPNHQGVTLRCGFGQGLFPASTLRSHWMSSSHYPQETQKVGGTLAIASDILH